MTGRVAECLTGKNPQGMTYHRFILTTVFAEVLKEASHRLEAMTQGRFSLQRDTERKDRRERGGLEITVLDAYTGTCRGVATLSGGESFLASLALALGLADVVQYTCGGCHLETMFIDEGFGSLDTEALDLALDEVLRLQRQGRMVGIVSHVAELRERLSLHLRVQGGPTGSRAAFSLPLSYR